ncbi:MAG TPA: FtsQ-type POTRA domain-containing protein [Acidimicrobiales bacterium]|nr:FtsQ-type POTRA domain-containing protein [Acidimicrobiales bacterium]
MSRPTATARHERRVEPAPPRRQVPAPRSRLPRLTKWLLVVGVVVTIVVLGAQWTLRQSYFRVQHVTVVGLRHESRAAFLDASGLLQHPSMIGLSDTSLKQRVSSFPWIHSVSLQKHWPNTVVVTVHENVAVAVAFTAKHELDYVDAAGNSLGTAPVHENLPTLEYVHPTSATWPFARSARAAAYVASQLPRAFSSQVSVITDDAQGSVTLQMTTPLTFILGPATNLHAKFVAVAAVIAHSTLQPGDVVDVTVPDELAVTPPSN